MYARHISIKIVDEACSDLLGMHGVSVNVPYVRAETTRAQGILYCNNKHKRTRFTLLSQRLVYQAKQTIQSQHNIINYLNLETDYVRLGGI